MQRRKFIHLSAAGGVAIGFAGLSCNHARSAFYSVLDKPRQLSYILDTKSIRDIGIGYRKQVPAENEEDTLVKLLSLDSSGNAVSASAEKVFAETVIDQKITRDFETGNTVVVKGWILAITEARQCALFYLNNQ